MSMSTEIFLLLLLSLFHPVFLLRSKLKFPPKSSERMQELVYLSMCLFLCRFPLQKIQDMSIKQGLELKVRVKPGESGDRWDLLLRCSCWECPVHFTQQSRFSYLSGSSESSSCSFLSSPSRICCSFAINIGHDRENIAMHLNPRLDSNTIVFNSLSGGSWGDEIHESNFPFRRGEECKVCMTTCGVWKM